MREINIPFCVKDEKVLAHILVTVWARHMWETFLGPHPFKEWKDLVEAVVGSKQSSK
jgi:hypothetical protein